MIDQQVVKREDRAKVKKRLPKQRFLSLMWLRKRLFWLDPFSFPLLIDEFGKVVLNKEGKPRAKPCSVFYTEIEYEKTEEKLYKSEGCEARAVCPVCGASYWRQKGREARSLFEAQRDQRFLAGGSVARWLLDFEFTLPVVLSRMIDQFDQANKVLYINRLSAGMYRVLARFFLKRDKIVGADIEYMKRRFGGVAVLHFWHSRDPFYPHYHFHVILSPLGASGDYLLEDSFVGKGRLERLRKDWAEAVSAVFGIGFRELVVHYQYVEENKKSTSGECLKSFYHRFNYTFRHWSEDLLKYKGKLREKAVKVALKRAKELEGIKKIRWFGYFSSVKRGQAGFELMRFFSDLTVCSKCEREFETEALIDSLNITGDKTIICPCGKRFEMKDLGKAKEWRKTGRRFVLRGFRKGGVLLIDQDTGEKKLVPYERINLFPFKGGKKRFVCRSP